jgi:hypothetical protein
VSKPYNLHYQGDECEAIIGSNRFTTRDRGYGTFMVPLSIDGVAVLAFTLQDGHLLLNLLAYDEHNRLVLVIKNNELVYSISPWDIQLVGRNLTIREAPRQFLLDIVFRPEYAFLVNSAAFLGCNTAVDCPFGLLFGPHSTHIGAVLRMGNLNRYRYDRREAFRSARRLASKVTLPYGMSFREFHLSETRDLFRASGGLL